MCLPYLVQFLLPEQYGNKLRLSLLAAVQMYCCNIAQHQYHDCSINLKWALVVMEWDQHRHTIYVLNELYSSDDISCYDSICIF